MARIPLKVCACEIEHFEIPEDARSQKSDDLMSGWYWECACGSTVFVYDSLAGCGIDDTDYDARARAEEEDREDERDRDFEDRKARGIL